jgi:hypothetical protein
MKHHAWAFDAVMPPVYMLYTQVSYRRLPACQPLIMGTSQKGWRPAVRPHLHSELLLKYSWISLPSELSSVPRNPTSRALNGVLDADSGTAYTATKRS